MSIIFKSSLPPACLVGARCYHTSSQAEPEVPMKVAFRMGVVADIQCCDIEDGFNYARTVARRYRGALQMLDKAVNYWNDRNIDVLCNLGDVIDGQCSFKTDSLKEIDAVLEKFNNLNGNVDAINLIGNHELYNFTRDELSHILNTSRNGGHPENICKEYYHLKPCAGYRIIVLDAYSDTVIGLKEDDPVFQKASNILMKNNKNMKPEIYNGGGSWYEDISGLERRFVPFNGGLGETQIQWLSAQLKEAHAQGEKCILMSHAPLHPDSCDGVAMIWDFPALIEALNQSPKGSVIAVLAGHDHKGGYHYDEVNQTHHITMKSPLNLGLDGDCFGVMDFISASSTIEEGGGGLKRGQEQANKGYIVLRGPTLSHFLHKKLLSPKKPQLGSDDSQEEVQTLIYRDSNGDECIKLPFNHRLK